MSNIAIQVEGLSKRYVIGEAQERYSTLRDKITNGAVKPFRALYSVFKRSDKTISNGDREFWALKDISFEIERGAVVGVIGHNGAGKSTLLKILSRITEPTNGYADIQGRVGSLLEVGTGFHQELTGRENIYLNGAILGMTRSEIDRKFDEIVEFAEVSRFIDTPVKHYSSGMHLRLAFAVAAHLEPEILLVDEVLAVGDLTFQKKCLGKMEDVAIHGRTVLFVSHNLAAIKDLCKTSIVLTNGRIAYNGDVVGGLAYYSQSILQNTQEGSPNGSGWKQIFLNNQPNGMNNAISGDKPFVVEAWLDLKDDFTDGNFICQIDDSIGNVIVHQKVDCNGLGIKGLKAGLHLLKIEFPPIWLAPGVYSLYFKMIGKRPTIGPNRFYSERVILDATGNRNSIGGKATPVLAPQVEWSLAVEL